MSHHGTPKALLTEARRLGQVTQRALAERGATAQSVIARIEGGLTSPTWDTLTRLLAAAGFELRATLHATPSADSHMLGDVARILRLTPEARLLELRNAARFLTAAKRRG